MSWKSAEVMRIAVAGFVAMAISCICVSGEANDEFPELPIDLWETIVKGDPPVVVRCDWERVRGLSFVQRAMDITQLSDIRKLPMIGSVLRAALVVEPVLGDIQVTYTAMRDPEGNGDDGAWLLTDLDREQMRTRLESENWIELPRLEGVFGEPIDENFERYVEYLLNENKKDEGYDRDDAILEASRGDWTIAIGEDGWVYASPGKRSPRKACCLFRPTTELLEAEGFRFPFDRMFEGGKSTLCRMAIDTPKNEIVAESSEAVAHSEQRQLEAELEQLRSFKERSMTGDIGDLLFVASEVDGGIAIDVEARAPDGTGGASTVDVLEGGLIAIRLITMWAGPHLSDELDTAIIHDLGDGIAGSVVLSEASLYEAVDRYVEHENRKEEIWDRIREIEKMKARERVE